MTYCLLECRVRRGGFPKSLWAPPIGAQTEGWGSNGAPTCQKGRRHRKKWADRPKMAVFPDFPKLAAATARLYLPDVCLLPLRTSDAGPSQTASAPLTPRSGCGRACAFIVHTSMVPCAAGISTSSVPRTSSLLCCVTTRATRPMH